MILDIDRINTLNGGHSILRGIDADVYRQQRQLISSCVSLSKSDYETSQYRPITYSSPKEDQDIIKELGLVWLHYRGLQKSTTISRQTGLADGDKIEQWYMSGVSDEVESYHTFKDEEINQNWKKVPKPTDVIVGKKLQSSFVSPNTNSPAISLSPNVTKVIMKIGPTIREIVSYTEKRLIQTWPYMEEDIQKRKLSLSQLLPTLAHLTSIGILKDTLNEVEDDKIVEAYRSMSIQIIDNFIQEQTNKSVTADPLTMEMELAKNIVRITQDDDIRPLITTKQFNIISKMSQNIS